MATQSVEVIQEAIGARSEILLTKSALEPDRAKVFDYVHGVEAKGNAADSDTSGELAGKNILIERHFVEDAAKEFNSKKTEFTNFSMRVASSY